MKKAIIIGASSGIGKGISLELLSKNYKIAISARRKDRLDEMLINVEISKMGELSKIHEYEQILAENIKNSLGVSVVVSVSKEGSVQRSEGKAVRVIDKRNL